jgi:hypothetical protein
MCDDWDDAEQTDTWDDDAHGDWMRYGIPEWIPDPRTLPDLELQLRLAIGWNDKQLERTRNENHSMDS